MLDLGDGTAVAFKVESHNHPSAVEPFQGAATGIGGILRDVIAMGARPIALLDGLWFGEPDFHFQQAVAGIGHYGNCVGVPTVGGQTVFDPAYASNCLVNAMCVGLVDSDRLRSAKASGPGRLVVLYGATTGRDGIGGASVLASAELSEDDADKRPSVQVGDPFTGKKLIEVSLELVESGLVESLQDCGAAGLASSLSEMASEGAGIDVHLDRVPLREDGMEPWEIMISESQERMVAVVRPEMFDAVRAVCERWELPCTAIGEVTGSGVLRAFHDDDVVGEIPAALLTDECPRYEVEQRAEPRPVRRVEPPEFDVTEVIEQYDHLVGSRTVRRPGLDAAVLRLRPSLRGLAVALQGPAPGETDGFRAGIQATLSAARNVACAGGEPIGLTDCLNFGNPEKPAIAHELAQAIEGIAQAAEMLGIPVVSGNVSLYNDADGTLDPTDAGRRLRRARPRRAARARPLAERRHRSPRDVAGRLARGRGGADPLPLEGRHASDALPRRREQRHRGRARRSSRLERRPRGRRRAPGRLRLAARRRDPRLPPRAREPPRLAWLRRDRAGPLAMCGVFGVYAPDRDVARLTYFGLFALQHRGQESAGIAVSEHGRLTALRDLGLVAQVFDEQKLGGLHGQVAIGHNRYSTTGSSQWANAQPLVQHGRARTVALGHNGNLINVGQLREELREAGVPLGTTSDSELIAALIANDESPLDEAVANAMRRLEGAYSIVALSEGRLIAFRDPHGFRPLVIGRIQEDCVFASESCALDLVGAELVREVAPGELVIADADGLHAAQALEQPDRGGALCIWEFFYLARPDSRLEGIEVHNARVRMGEQLAREAPVEADLVLPIPDSGTPAAIGFARELGLPFSEGLIKNRYVQRTFIQPDQELRRQGIKLKYHPVAEVAGKRVVAVDDSIVRGNTTREIVRMLFDAGAAEVHLRVSSPPVVGQCFYGIDLADPAEMIASTRSVEEIREHVGATSLAYLSHDGLVGATRRPASGLCRACLTGEYPTEVPDESAKLRFEAARA